ncbi:Glycoside hydrolase 2 (Mannanase, beta-galactosidase) [Emydomyces testavorans]|uniref:Glycoside hydrolase 2 (Mannanase, beta-galactosidase) n=1 Tax=Emydomyces testavorans TaxID=2070801 RepID=A0AAF0DGC2_9EURO|nr:Glycoside hydrolase 2 (Mannanase, beta-galactosidase) [Emydomyces testavorans]
MEDQVNKPHRKSREKGKKTKDKSGPNVKAFAVSRPGRSQRQAARAHDVKERRLHVPLVDRLPEEAPPIIVAVVGPPGVGKTTLIKSLIKRYSKQTLSSPTGPLTVVTSKRRRLTFLECPSDSLASMIDVAKIADIVLLMIDGNYGFEMETMEFLNALSASGMPGNVFGILTHLDLYKKMSTLRQAKKRLKHRFWSELYQGAKLFYLSGIINGRYPDREIHNLSRFLSVMKNPRPLIWRNSHPYSLADRFLDITPPTTIEENPKCDRTIALYGYLRGTNFPAVGARVHVPGAGDFNVSSIEALPDPCPTPYMDQAMAKVTGKSNRKRLGEKQKLLFAPMSDVGGVLVDKDAVYIEVKTSTFNKEEEDEEEEEERGLGEQLVIGLQSERKLLGETTAGVRLFRDGDTLIKPEPGAEGRKEKRNVRFMDDEENRQGMIDEDEGFESAEEDEDEDEEDDADVAPPPDFDAQFKEKQSGISRPEDGDIAFADSDSDLGSISSVEDQELESAPSDYEDEGDDDGTLHWKENLAAHAKALFKKPAYRIAELTRMLYDDSIPAEDVARKWRGDDLSHSGKEPTEEDDFFKKTNVEQQELDDRTIPNFDYEELEKKWQDEENLELLRHRFASVKFSKHASDGEENADEDGEGGSEFEGDGAFEDLETGEVVTGNQTNDNEDVEEQSGSEDLDAEREKNARRKEELKLRFEEEDREGFANAKDGLRAAGDEQFGTDEWYDAQKAALQKQLDINRAEFDNLDALSRARAEGYKAGTYARIVLENVPCEFSTSFNPRFPIIVGGLAPTEDRFGFVQVRIKRHRWHKKILKTNDPLIFSLGWRRFQTLPIYSISDSRTRNRMLKYTPEHMHCFGTFYGPLVAPNTGFCCVQSFSNKTPGFRIAATGVVLSVDEGCEIVKKLKLTGYPYKIFRNTAFIKDMFNSALEIAKFEGAAIRTVSGVRGQIKRALSKPEGHFRATFEDKILMSDIVFLRTWYPIKPTRFYNPVTNLLDVEDEAGKGGWKAMRLTGEVRRDQGIPTPLQKDSAYRPIARPTRHFNPLRVPRQLAADLPFKSQIVRMRPRKRQTYMQKRAVVLGGEEKKARDLLQKLTTLRNEKVAKRQAAQEERRKVYRAKMAENLEKKVAREKREKQEFWSKEGKKRKNESGDGGGGKKRR